MYKFYLDSGDEGPVYPLLGCHPACLADDGAQVSLGEAYPVGVVTYLMLLMAVLVDQLDEAVEDSLLMRFHIHPVLGAAPIQFVVVVHQCRH